MNHRKEVMKVLNQQIKKQRIKELALEKAEFRNGLLKLAIIIIAIIACFFRDFGKHIKINNVVISIINML